MDHALAKELKDTGFPQKGRDGSFYVGANRTTPFIPILSELIDACIALSPDFMLGRCDSESWKAGIRILGHWKYSKGATPDEAVARLWLVLKKLEKNSGHT